MVTPGKQYGLAKDATVAAGNAQLTAANAQLVAGVPPAVSNTQSGTQILKSGSGSPYTVFTMPAAGRLWVAAVSFSMVAGSGSAGASQQSYCQLVTAGGKTLALVECAVTGTAESDSNTAVVTYPGLALANGTVINLDVNNAVIVTGILQRGSGLVVVSIP